MSAGVSVILWIVVVTTFKGSVISRATKVRFELNHVTVRGARRSASGYSSRAQGACFLRVMHAPCNDQPNKTESEPKAIVGSN